MSERAHVSHACMALGIAILGWKCQDETGTSPVIHSNTEATNFRASRLLVQPRPCTYRPLTLVAGVSAEAAGTCGSSPAACDLSELTATEAVKALCDRTITAVAYASAMLKKAEEWECLNAYAHLNATKVRKGGSRYLDNVFMRSRHLRYIATGAASAGP